MKNINILLVTLFTILLVGCNFNNKESDNTGITNDSDFKTGGTITSTGSITNTGITNTGSVTNSGITSSQDEADVLVNNSKLGNILTDGSGMTLYIFFQDSKNKSVCYSTCAVNWPPLIVKDVPKIAENLIASKFSYITRDDGNRQVTFEGNPLYYYNKDINRGDTNGEGFSSLWYTYKVEQDDLSSNTGAENLENNGTNQ